MTELAVLSYASNRKLRANPVCTAADLKGSGISSSWYLSWGKGKKTKISRIG